MSQNTQTNKSNGRDYRYHPRSDTHSKTICRLVVSDLARVCPEIAEDAAACRIAYCVNQPMVNPQDPNRQKTVDLAIGEPAEALPPSPEDIAEAKVSTVRIAVEAKSCMTEHIKSKPRLYDELNSSHTIVHAAYPDAVAAGLVVVNIAARFASPTRQHGPDAPLEVTEHRSPHCAADLIEHLRKLPIAQRLGDYGFDALAIIVVDCDNLGPARLHDAAPAPQPGDPLHYATCLQRICDRYRGLA